MQRINIKGATRISVFAALMVVCAWIWIPGPVPFTMQAFGVFLAAALMGERRACAATLVYILLGAAGVPVFSGARGGIGVLLGPTGGFILGFLPMAYLCGKICSKIKRSPQTLILSMLAGLLGCYITGTLWYAILFLGENGKFALGTAVMQCVVPFIIPDLLKIFLAAFISNRLLKHTKLFN